MLAAARGNALAVSSAGRVLEAPGIIRALGRVPMPRICDAGSGKPERAL